MGLWREGALKHMELGAALDPHLGPISGGSFADDAEKLMLCVFWDGCPLKAKVIFTLGSPGSCSTHCQAIINDGSVAWITRGLDFSALQVDFEGT